MPSCQAAWYLGNLAPSPLASWLCQEPSPWPPWHPWRREIPEMRHVHHLLALEHAFNNFGRLFGAHIHVARHASLVAKLAHNLLASLEYPNGRPVCKIYSTLGHGPIVSFNLYAADGSAIGFIGFEKLSSYRKFALRTGGMCNPGGLKKYCEISDDDIDHLFSIGKSCGDHIDIVNGRNIGIIRISFGACSTVEDVLAFVEFIKEAYMVKRKQALHWNTI